MVGASGGPQIISGTALVAARHLLMKQNLKEAIDAPRVHHQLLPMKVSAEFGVPEVRITICSSTSLF